MISYILTGLYILSCLVLILFVLLQPGKSDASQVFGGGANSTAFGPRGTQTVLAKITIGAAITFFLIAFLFSIPGLFEKKSVGEGVEAVEQPAPVVPQETQPPAATEQTPQTSAPAPASSQPAATSKEGEKRDNAAKPPAEKKPEPKKSN